MHRAGGDCDQIGILCRPSADMAQEIGEARPDGHPASASDLLSGRLQVAAAMVGRMSAREATMHEAKMSAPPMSGHG